MERDSQVGTRAVVGPAGDAWGTQGGMVFKLLGAPAVLSCLLGKSPPLLWHVMGPQQQGCSVCSPPSGARAVSSRKFFFPILRDSFHLKVSTSREDTVSGKVQTVTLPLHSADTSISLVLLLHFLPPMASASLLQAGDGTVLHCTLSLSTGLAQLKLKQN